MTNQGEGKDESSIASVSSLLSRFEKIKTDGTTPVGSPVLPRSPFLPPAGTTPIARPITPLRDVNPSFRPPFKEDETDRQPSKPRPQSMLAASPSRRAPPLVTIDSPRSPENKQTTFAGPRPSQLTPQAASPAISKPRADSSAGINARPPSRTPTPALEARISAFAQPIEFPKAASDGANTRPPTPQLKPKTQTSSVPPPVNRAGKPQIPLKPTNLSKKPEGLSAPERSADLTDQSVSPFSTPPSSRSNSPRRRQDSSASHERNPSDPFIFDRTRTNSDTPAAVSARARVGSNASFVEPSSLPESGHHFSTSPAYPTVATIPEQQPYGVSPPRYRPIGSRERTAAGDLPEHRPRLPARPELQVRSGRSPPKSTSGRISPVKRDVKEPPVDTVKRAATFDTQTTHHRIPATKPIARSALSLGFDRAAQPSTSKVAQGPPAVPPPRRSMDQRRDMPPANPNPTNGYAYEEEETVPVTTSFDGTSTQPAGPADYPDSSQASRRPPKFKSRPFHIPTEYDTRVFAVCGQYVCTTGHRTKVWDLWTGQQLLDMEHLEIIKVSSLVFKPTVSPDDEGSRIWLGTSTGDIHELDVPSQTVIKVRPGVHSRREILRMFRYASELWTLDDGGDLNVWMPDHKGMPSLDSQFNTFRTPRGHTFSIALGPHLWIATGKDIRVFAPSAKSNTDFQVLLNPLSQPGTGEIHSGATLSDNPDLVYFGHSDGKVSVYNRHDFSCAAVINVSSYKLSSLAGVGEYLWAGFNTGMVYVYDTSTTPWRVKKDWQAHEKQVCGIVAERSSVWKMGRLQAVTLGTDNVLRIWDGTLEDDWIDSRMQERDNSYCNFREISTAVLTWNAGASKPSYLQQNADDDNFFREYMTTYDPPDIFIFGFQELVDLEDKKLTARTFFKGSKKKDANEQEHMSHQYRSWRDHLTRCLDEYMPPSQTYVLLHTASLVGLFTCVFVKSTLRSRIRHVQGVEVKRGMGGIYGNKGALVLRMILDDSSLCFINCHLAAGQTQTIHRNNDVAAILESDGLPPYPLDSDGAAQHSDVFTSGGDGSMILDHEICILNGDLNYRIDTMGRDTVVKHVAQNNLWRLLERDQLLLSRRKNPGFRLRAFQESEIRFAPTYKYNLHTDDYDTSEKRRSPAWCDRILYRGLGKVRMEEYRRWEVRVSDHRPVSGWLRLRVKTVDPAKRAKVLEACQAEFEVARRKLARAVELEYLTDVLGLSPKEAAAALQGSK